MNTEILTIQNPQNHALNQIWQPMQGVSSLQEN